VRAQLPLPPGTMVWRTLCGGRSCAPIAALRQRLSIRVRSSALILAGHGSDGATLHRQRQPWIAERARYPRLPVGFRSSDSPGGARTAPGGTGHLLYKASALSFLSLKLKAALRRWIPNRSS